MTDLEILQKVFEKETDPRTAGWVSRKGWTLFQLGIRLKDVSHLIEDRCLENMPNETMFFRLTDRGRGMVAETALAHEQARIPAARVLEAMEGVVGFDDIKETIARSVEGRRRVHILLQGPPASAKSLLLEAVRVAAAEAAYMAFGSRTSAAGLSDVLFQHRPAVLELDELDKLHHDALSILLGLMETGEVLETKSRQTRGVTLNCQVLAACNRSHKMPPEVLSRFAFHATFPPYTRDQFVEVARLFLPKVEGCPPDLAERIGAYVFDYGLGDIRRTLGVWKIMQEPTDHEVKRVIDMMLKYAPPDRQDRRQNPAAARFGGM